MSSLQKGGHRQWQQQCPEGIQYLYQPVSYFAYLSFALEGKKILLLNSFLFIIEKYSIIGKLSLWDHYSTLFYILFTLGKAL